MDCRAKDLPYPHPVDGYGAEIQCVDTVQRAAKTVAFRHAIPAALMMRAANLWFALDMSGLSKGRHVDAFFRALAAGFGADAAMFHSMPGMFFAFFGAGGTDVCAQLTKGIDVPAVHHHDLCGRTADGGAFQIEPDTSFQRFHLLFFEACRGALLAHGGAIDTGVDTGLIFCIRHKNKF
jgi:hypothetical protein